MEYDEQSKQILLLKKSILFPTPTHFLRTSIFLLHPSYFLLLQKLTFYQQSINDYPVSSCFSQKIILGTLKTHDSKNSTIRSFTNKQMILKKMLQIACNSLYLLYLKNRTGY